MVTIALDQVLRTSLTRDSSGCLIRLTMKTPVALSLMVMVLVGCASQPTEPGRSTLTSRERQCLGRVQVLMYDTAKRSPSQSVEIYDETKATKPSKEIALLTCEGAAKEEVDMTKGLIEKARLLGADAIVILPANVGSDFQMGHGGSRAVFRAKAVVYQ